MSQEAVLDNPIWSSLTTTHAGLAVGANVGGGLARGFPQAIGPLAGIAAEDEAAYADLAAVVPPDDVAVLFLQRRAALPAGWRVVRDGALVQMICRTAPAEVRGSSGEIVALGEADFPEMVALATLTEPGPFRARTGTLGGFLGVRVDGRLAAMAGRRLAPAGYVEVSAVCTHPDFRGRGYAGVLVAAVARGIVADGLTPFLTSFASNAGAIRVYEQVGFRYRRSFELAVLRAG